jgi:hypothetical protein
METEGYEEKYRAVIDGGHPEDEPVGQRWGKVSNRAATKMRQAMRRWSAVAFTCGLIDNCEI